VVGGASGVTVVCPEVAATVELDAAGSVAEVVVASPVVAMGAPPQAPRRARVSATAVLRMMPSVRKPAA
jgi:hypothetical protein